MKQFVANRISLLIMAFGLSLAGEAALAQQGKLQLARFDIDVTPPVGSMMAYDRVIRHDELRLRCRGIVLFGSGEPIVLCAVDWIGIANESHDAFRDVIAKAAGTTRQRVAVHTLHQHDAPRCDFTAERLLNEAGVSDLGALQGAFVRVVLKRLGDSVRSAIKSPTPVTHAAIGKADVEKVASNRRIQDETGKVVGTRYTACRDAKLRQLPEGTVDRELTTVAFYNEGNQSGEESPVAILSYYACHPQSYYRTGIPSSDFPGIARFMRGQDMPDTLHVHFNGAGGNIGAGKYNDGSKANRLVLANRIADGMRRSFESAVKFPLAAKDVGWYVASVALPLGQHLGDTEALRKEVPKWDVNDYWGSPEQLAWALRCKSGHKMDLGCLKIGDLRILHMPGELFVEYQLAAKKLRPKLTVAMAAYGDYGPGYIGTDESYGQGGYETSKLSSKVAKGVEQVLMGGVKKLLDEADAADDFSAELPRIPPTDPSDALKKFNVKDGYQIQIVANEPLIGSPVAIEWDADGRMYVCEMRGYSEDRDAGLSTIGLLTDNDEDGKYDSRTEFASGLLWPTAIFPYDGGLFVGDAPNLYYMKDTNGDGRADIKEVVLTGFGTTNVQGLMNSMRWGLDNRIHIACSSSGGKIHRPGSDKIVNIRGRDIAFDPRTYAFEPTSGAAQHGMCFDDWGRKFVSSNSDHIMQVMYDDHHIARNPFLLAPSARVSIAADGPQAEVYRASPTEPWRIVRTRLRVSGAVKGIVEGGGRAAGYFTGATGLTIYRGDAWPREHRGLAIVGDVGSNLIHRKRLARAKPDSVQFSAERMDEKSEFVTSSDIWFRPCQFANAPDGSLHVIDFCREVIEHPKSLPPQIKKHLDLTAGRDRGRIYRIVPDGYVRRKPPKLSRATTDELVALLGHSNAWHRETAMRLLFQKRDKQAVPLLRRAMAGTERPLERMHALHVLAGLDSLDAATLRLALKDSHEQVRRHAVLLAEREGMAEETAVQLIAMAADTSQEVRLQLAYALGAIYHPRRLEALAELIRRDRGKWMQVAVQSAVAESATELLEKLIQDRQFRSPQAGQFLKKLAMQVREQDPTGAKAILALFEGMSREQQPAWEPAFALPIFGELLRDGAEGSLQKNGRMISQMIGASVNVATNANEDEGRRIAAIESLAYGSVDDVGGTLTGLISHHQPNAVQAVALKTLGRFDHPTVGSAIVGAWPRLSPSIRKLAIDELSARPRRAVDLFDALDAGTISKSELPIGRLKMLTGSRDKRVAGRATEVLESLSLGQRSEVVSDYRESLKIAGDARRGRVVFEKNCSSCHRMNGVGYELGPNLASMKSRGAEAILINVLDPSREVNPLYLDYQVVKTDGRVVTGMITAENATSVTLQRGEGATDTIRRGEIDEIRSTRVSIMPDGLEKSIDVSSMADLIAYLMRK